MKRRAFAGTWAAVMAVLTLAGCLGPSGTDADGEAVDPTVPIEVHDGTWVVFRPDVERGDSYSWSGEANTRLPDYEAKTQDSYSCLGLGGFFGWLDTRLVLRDLGAAYVARRDDTTTVWAAYQAADAEAMGPFGLGGLYNHPGEPRFLVALDQFGPGVESSLVVDEFDTPYFIEDRGRFWCLSGVARYDGGTFQATPYSVEAEGLSWKQHMDGGVLLRVKWYADSLTLHAVAPDGARHTLPVPDHQGDMTFCSPLDGEWTIEVESLRSVPVQPWELTVLVFEGVQGAVPCTDMWQFSRLDTDAFAGL